MNLDKQAEVIAGFTSKEVVVIVIGLIIDLLLTSLILFFAHNFLLFLIVSGFIGVNIIAAVKLMQNLPDGFVMNYFENKKMPKIFMPGDNNEPDKI